MGSDSTSATEITELFGVAHSTIYRPVVDDQALVDEAVRAGVAEAET
ncbi:hypothetical protein [Leifsonia sp. 71-9]|nr:hypothetical protein [Leifsonia sp. 71-9]